MFTNKAEINRTNTNYLIFNYSKSRKSKKYRRPRHHKTRSHLSLPTSMESDACSIVHHLWYIYAVSKKILLTNITKPSKYYALLHR